MKAIKCEAAAAAGHISYITIKCEVQVHGARYRVRDTGCEIQGARYSAYGGK